MEKEWEKRKEPRKQSTAFRAKVALGSVRGRETVAGFAIGYEVQSG